MACLFVLVTSIPLQAEHRPSAAENYFWRGEFKSLMQMESETSSPADLAYWKLWGGVMNYFLKGSPENYEHLSDFLEKGRTGKGEKNDFEAFYLAESYLLHAISAVQAEKELDALFYFRNAYRLSGELEARSPSFKPIRKTRGVIHLILGAVPSEYNWLLEILGWEGSVTLGLKELRSFHKSEEHSKEARLIELLFRNLLLSEKFTAEELSGLMLDEQDKLSQLVYLFIMHKSAHSDEVLKQQSLNNPFPHLYFWFAEANLRSGNYDRALLNYSLFLKKAIDDFLKDEVEYKIYMTYVLKGDFFKAIEWKSDRSTGNADFDKDIFGVLSVKDEGDPELLLLKARLAMDGGFYEESENHLQFFQNLGIEEPHLLLESVYRSGRLAHLRGDLMAAEKYYMSALNMSGDFTGSYFLPASCYHLGILYQKKTDYTKAETYFRRTLSYKRHQYKNSLDKQARAKLSEIKSIHRK